jgi:16S rRNA (adenine1518-N6/adenine1519-N6)-dimethyltransferase
MDRFKKSLGQNFLTDKNIIKKLLRNVPSNYPILEIGTGNGNLTIELISHTQEQIISYEIDEMAFNEAKERLQGFENLTLLLQDFLTAELNFSKPYIIVANIPYNITSPIIAKCLSMANIHSIYFLIQKEMADRVIAKNGTKDYSSFSIFCQTRAKCTRLFNIPATCFVPQPKVDSSYIELIPTNEFTSTIKDIAVYNKIVKNSFWGKRKTLLNCLVKGPYIKFKKEEILQVFEKLQIQENIRGQQLSVENFINLSNNLK